MGLSRITISGPPLTLDDVKAHLRLSTVDGETAITDDDALLTSLLDAATDRLEQMTGRLFRAAQYRLTLDAFPDGDDPIICPRPPLRDVVSLDYVATDGTLTSYTGFQQDTDSIPGRVFPAIDDVWPSTREQPAAVTMVFDCGYASAADVPDTVKHALKLFCELEYDDLSPAKAARVEARIAALVRGLSVRASALAGVGQ